jgi:hypothetical protein
MMANLAATRPTASILASVPVSTSMRRHVVLLAPPWHPVPPHGYGGIEAVVALLTESCAPVGIE